MSFNRIYLIFIILSQISILFTTQYVSKLLPALLSSFHTNDTNLIFRTKDLSSDGYYARECNLNETEKRLPKAIIIGVKKSGTYALLRYLSINPIVKPALKINGCKLNEIHYFDSDQNYDLGDSWYKSQMPDVCTKSAKETVIEKTPGYFRSEKAVERIYDFSPDIKLILIVRDPVKRLQSELTHCDTRQKKLNLERKCAGLNYYFESVFNSSRNASSLEEKDKILKELETNRFIRNSIYYLDIQNWLRYFKLNRNLIVINGDSFIKNPWFELKRLERYLNLPSLIQKRHFHFDSEKNFYCINKDVKQENSTGCLGKNKGRKNHVYLSPFVKKELQNYFLKWNQLFFYSIGQSFNW